MVKLFLFLCFIFSFLSFRLHSTPFLTMDEAVAIAIANHPVARNAALLEQKDAMKRQQSVEIAPLNLRYLQRNAATLGNAQIWSITQDFGSIPEHLRRAQLYRAESLTKQIERTLTLDELIRQVKAAYMNVAYYGQRLQIMQEHIHYFEALISIAEIHLFVDSISDLLKVSTGARYASYRSRMYIAEEELKRAEMRLRQLMFVPDAKIETYQAELQLYQIHPEKPLLERFDPMTHNLLDAAQIAEAESAVKLEKSKLYPAIHAGYFQQNIEGMNSYQGWMIGLSVPLWAQPQRARIKQAEIDIMVKAYETEYRQFADRQHIETLKSLLNEYFVQISFTKENLLLEAELTLKEIEIDFATGRITDYAEAFTKVSNAVYAKLEHLEYIILYNHTALELEYLTQ